MPFKIIYNVYKRLYNYNFGYYGRYNIPFEFPKPMPPNSFEVMKKGCDILNKLGIKYCISFGTLLGIYRDNRLIPHDSDLDIDAMHPVNARKIEKEFIKNGFKLGGKVVALGVVQKLAFYTEDEVVFDIEFYQKIGNFVYSFHEKNLYWKFPVEYYENFDQYIFLDYMVHIPHDPKRWLEYTYGKNWRIPKTSKRDFNEDQFFDKEGYGMHVSCEGNIIDEIRKLKKNRKLKK
ncbi:hypothetical protein ES705_48005 [subsurface metagenome]